MAGLAHGILFNSSRGFSFSFSPFVILVSSCFTSLKNGGQLDSLYPLVMLTSRAFLQCYA